VLKTLPSVLLATTLICLAGCKTHSAPPVDEQALKTFTHDMQQALYRSIVLANTGEQVGAVMLKVTLDRNSAPIGCESRRAPLSYEQQLPAGVMRSDRQALNSLVEAQCWKTIYPVVPKDQLDKKGEVEVRAPMVLVLPAAVQAPGSDRYRVTAQQQYFWQHLLRDQPVSSIGRASVTYQASAQGQVEGCLVQLYPHPLRPDAFRLDGTLQAQLNSRCMALDLSKMPGFASNEPGPVNGYSVVDYAPWRVGRP
jgi:hypothetical protein